jgi:dTMP kinase
VGSNIAHQAGRLRGVEREDVRVFIERLEYDIYQLPRADLVILLDLPAIQAQELIAKKPVRSYTDDTRDLQEANVAYQENVRQLYLDIAAANTSWHKVELAPAGELRSIDDIAAEILAVVQREC